MTIVAPCFDPRLLLASLALMACVAPAQSPTSRPAMALLGHQSEPRLSFQGVGRFVDNHPDAAPNGRAAAVKPSEAESFFGFTVAPLPATEPSGLRLMLWWGGAKPAEFEARLDEFEAGDAPWDRGIAPLKLVPGRNDLILRLADIRGAKTARALDFRTGIAALRCSRRKIPGDASELVLLGIAYEGEPAAVDLERRLTTRLAAAEDVARELHNASPDRREEPRAAMALLVREIHGALAGLPEPRRVRRALAVLESETELEPLRRIAREALAGLSDREALTLLKRAAERLRGRPLEPELLLALGTAADLGVRAESVELLRKSQGLKPEARTALLNGLIRRDDEGLLGLASAVEELAPWPLRVALVRALAAAPEETALPALVQVLRQGGALRVRHDAADALAARTGRDLGLDPEAWARWLAAQKGAPPPIAGPTYQRFYGIPLLPGRIVFVLDLSGSMRDPIVGGRAEEHLKTARHLQGKEIKTRLDLAIEELVHALEGLDQRSEVGLIGTSDSASWVGKGIVQATPEAVEDLKKKVRALSAGGATNLHDGLLLAFHPGRKPAKDDVTQGPDTVFLVTDGDPSAGPVMEREGLRDLLLRWNLGRAIKIHTINVGPGRRDWLAEVSTASGGRFLDLTTRD